MKKVISLFFVLAVIGSPSLSWVGSDGGCFGFKNKTRQETKTEQVKENDD